MGSVPDEDGELTVIVVYESVTEDNGATMAHLGRTNVKWHSANSISTLKHYFLLISSTDYNNVLEHDAATRRQ